MKNHHTPTDQDPEARAMLADRIGAIEAAELYRLMQTVDLQKLRAAFLADRAHSRLRVTRAFVNGRLALLDAELARREGDGIPPDKDEAL